ncbi:MAG: hypothetical protein M3R01_02195 [Actinomycetota bacterium]|nr:hypothetical protein [Actinomycetota bacterium]
MTARCDAHPFDVAGGLCESCRRDYCPGCLVYPKGEHRPPVCIPCALSAGGVRRNARRARRG